MGVHLLLKSALYQSNLAKTRRHPSSFHGRKKPKAWIYNPFFAAYTESL